MLQPVAAEDPCGTNDATLWQRFTQGDYQSFATLYTRHIHSMLHYGRMLHADTGVVKDCIHDLFVEFWNNRNRLPPAVPVSAYFHKALRYKVLRKAHGALILKAPEDAIWQQAPPLPAEPEFIEREAERSRTSRMQRAIATLPPRQQEVIHLSYYKGYSIRQIAGVMKMNYQSVANLQQRSLQSLRKHFRFFVRQLPEMALVLWIIGAT